MYGIPAKRFDPDLYKGHKNLRNNDFAIGFVVCGLIWFLLFRLAWYAAPILIVCVSLVGLLFKFRRRYFIYGALSLIFLPFVVFAAFTVGFAGRNEVKS